ncbi:hypothetical protein GGI25_005947 [Coemansia spiralis]|uniref:Uncharacterized protein n=2 Tax=Coemansia TaxID=4863 RepID=A0A9W8KVS2_9FUNG|nr:hypothetical protein EDC05_004994 [Coemansia umbellata]KAJ2619925.1 hypothetical protein GGI26_005421 [Coemansia sp. RSA 1358]KAJ2670136.1 hypothetical protein GGI25_005947 [Coemansia spiralis]
MPSNNNKYTCKECGYTIEGNMGHASSCSKKSYINTSERLSMAFAAIIMIITIDNTEHEITVSGRTTDGPFSSTNDEFMAIAAAVLAILKHTSATIHTDSQAAMAAAQGQLGKTDSGRDNKAYLESEVQLCPCGCGKKKDQSHILACTHGLTVKAPATMKLKRIWRLLAMLVAVHHTQALEPTVMMSELWQLETKEATERGNC